MKESRQATFFDHLEELRRRLLVCVGVWLLFFGLAFWQAPTLIRFFLREAFRGIAGVNLYFFKPQEAFLLALDTGAIVALLATVPVILLEAVLFLFPGCTRRERRGMIAATFASVVLAAAGSAFGWFFLRPFCFNFFFALMDRFSGLLNPGVTLSMAIGTLSAIRLILTLILACALAFQLPVVMLLLYFFRIVPRETLARSRPFMYPIVLIVAAIITPPDVLSQILVSLPLIALFEATLLICRFIPVDAR